MTRPVRVSAAILVGGKSRRMGTDKALIDVGGFPLIQRVLRAVRPLTSDLMLVGSGAERFAGHGQRPVADLTVGDGPLGGIYSALRAARFEHCLVLACDMPFLNTRLLHHLCQRAQEWDALVPRLADGHLEPLHALYARTCIGAIESMLSAGLRSPLDLYGLVRTGHVAASEIRRLDPDFRSFVNLNTPTELALLREAPTLAAPRDGEPETRPGPCLGVAF